MSAIETIIPLRSAAAHATPLHRRLAASGWAWLLLTLRNRRTRRHLRDLSNASLEDIGLDRAQARAEIRRSHFLL